MQFNSFVTVDQNVIVSKDYAVVESTCDSPTDHLVEIVTNTIVNETEANIIVAVGTQGPPGGPGPQGDDAFQTWLKQPGNSNKTFEQYIEAIRGPQGVQGDSNMYWSSNNW